MNTTLSNCCMQMVTKSVSEATKGSRLFKHCVHNNEKTKPR